MHVGTDQPLWPVIHESLHTRGSGLKTRRPATLIGSEAGLWHPGRVEADYVIVGAGAAGCVLAQRLSRHSSVVLVEAGGTVRNPLVAVPKAFYRTMTLPRYSYGYATDEGVGPPGHWVRGKGLGGSTVINGQLYLRGDPADYDALAARGNPGWGWPEMRRAYQEMESKAPRDGSGAVSGPLAVAARPVEDSVLHTVREAAEQLGIPVTDELYSLEGERIAPTPTTIRSGRRVSAADAFLAPARRRSALTVLTGARAGHLLFDGRRAVGVRVSHRGRPRDLRARREVILSAGTIETPLLLERSGVGRPEVLAAAGIAVRVPSPHVGERVLEQRAVTVKAHVRPGLGLGERLASRSGRFRAGLRYLLTRDGPAATGPYEMTALVAARARADGGRAGRPDAQLLFTPLVTDDTGLRAAPVAGLTIQGFALRPTTPSSIHVAGDVPEVPPRIVARYLQTEADRRTSAAVLSVARRLLDTAPLSGIVVGEAAPGPEVAAEPDDVAAYALATGAGIYHAVGSCAMGPNDDDVIDHRLRVRGVPGLRVIDASAFPEHPGGGLAAPVMALAWRAAELIDEEDV